MRTPEPLPAALAGRAFTAAEAAALGVPRHRLRARDVVGVSRGIYRQAGAEVPLAERVRLVTEAVPDGLASHHTSGLIHGFWLPDRIQKSADLHITRPPGSAQVRRLHVVGHLMHVFEEELCEVDGIRLTTPARTWMDLAPYLGFEELTALGDQMVRIPRPTFEQRSAPWATVESLADLLDRHRYQRGVARARKALEHVRVGSDSVPETRLRLKLVARGLPEPETQLLLDPLDPYSYSADLGYRRLRLALQYDGATHREPGRRRKDNRRNEAFLDAGWRNYVFDDRDLADGFEGAAAKVRRALAAAGARHAA